MILFCYIIIICDRVLWGFFGDISFDFRKMGQILRDVSTFLKLSVIEVKIKIKGKQSLKIICY